MRMALVSKEPCLCSQATSKWITVFSLFFFHFPANNGNFHLMDHISEPSLLFRGGENTESSHWRGFLSYKDVGWEPISSIFGLPAGDGLAADGNELCRNLQQAANWQKNMQWCHLKFLERRNCCEGFDICFIFLFLPLSLSVSLLQLCIHEGTLNWVKGICSFKTTGRGWGH